MVVYRYGANCVLAVGRVLLLPALAGRRFRLTGQDLAFPLAKWVSAMRVVFGMGGWPNGMVQLLVGAVS